MVRCLWFLRILVLPVLGFCDVIGSDLDYAGLIINCKHGCGDKCDPHMRNICEIFDSMVQEVLPKKTFTLNYLNHYNTRHWVTPWICEKGGCTIYNWQASHGKFDEYNKPIFMSLTSHRSLQDVAARLRNDLHFFYVTAPQDLIKSQKEVLLKFQAGLDEGYHCCSGDFEFYNCYYNDDWDESIHSCYGELYFWCPTIEHAIKGAQTIIQDQEEYFTPRRYENVKTLVENTLQSIDAQYKSMFVGCLLNHQEEGSRFNTALENLMIGDFEEAFEHIRFLIDLAEKHNLGNDLLAKLHLLKGQVQSDCCLYADAIVALSTSIQKNPSNKEAYFERAAAYFELGEFNKAIVDFLESGLQSDGRKHQSNWKTPVQIGLGITVGIIEAGSHEILVFIPEALGSIRGLARGLWAFAQHPVNSSNAFADAAVACVQYIKDTSTLEALQMMVPELRELIQNYDQLEDYAKGKLIGQIIGRYGVDILACKYSVKAVEMYINLKKANQLMTLEALASPSTSQKIIAEAGKQWTHREAILKNGTLKIDWGKQGKHMIDHKNYIPEIDRSIWEYPREKTQKLIDKFAGTGRKASKSTTNIPGAAGYQEIVNFGEFIGYDINQTTKIKTPTTWGKIHYANDGVHVVPYLPKE